MRKAPNIDRLAGALNAWQSDGGGGPSRLEHWLTIVIERGASDLRLVAGVPPSIRVDGTISSLPEGPLDGPEIEDAVLPVLPERAAHTEELEGLLRQRPKTSG